MPKYNGYGEAADIEFETKKEVTRSVKGKKDFATAMIAVDQQDARESVDRSTKNLAPTVVDPNSGIEYGRGRITEYRCHVCQHPYRDWIETMLIRGANYKSLQDRIPPIEGHHRLDRRGISNHHKKHMDLQDAALRAILEKEAEFQGQNFDEGVEDAITKRGVLEVALRKGYEDIINGVTTVEPRDLIQIAKVLGDMDTNQHTIGLDELRAQVQIFIQAIKEVCDQATQNDIAEAVKRLRKRENIAKKIEDVMDGPPMPVIDAVVIEHDGRDKDVRKVYPANDGLRLTKGQQAEVERDERHLGKS